MKAYNGFSPSLRRTAHKWLDEQNRTTPRKCQACSQHAGPILFHTEDYRRPYGTNIGQYALCYICSTIMLSREHRPDNYAEYKRLVSMGYRWEHNGTSFPVFRRRFLLGLLDDDCKQYEPPEKNWLGLIEAHSIDIRKSVREERARKVCGQYVN